MAQLTVDLPADLEAEAADRNVTVHGLVQEAFRHLGNRVAEDMLEADGSAIA